MIKRLIAISLSVVSLMFIVGCGFFFHQTNRDTITIGRSTLKEIKSTDYNSNIISHGMRTKFDLKKILTGDNYTYNTYVFSGTVQDIKLYEVSWTDEKGEEWGPFTRTILSVKIKKEYTGSATSENGIVRVLTTEVLSAEREDTVKINIGDTYVFVNCWSLDDKYFGYISENDPISYENDISLQQADVIMGGAWNSVFPVENNTVMVYHEYFENNTDVLQKKLSASSINSDKFVSSDSILNDEYIILNVTDFEKSFSALLDDIGTSTQAETK